MRRVCLVAIRAIPAMGATSGGWDFNWDRRKPVLKSPPSTPNDQGNKTAITQRRERHILLIRHGQYVYSPDVDDDAERVLTDFDRIWVSTMTRAKETADIIKDCLPECPPMEFSDMLREGCPCEPIPTPLTYSPSESELFLESARAEAGYRMIFHRPNPAQSAGGEQLPQQTYEVVVAHGNLIRFWTLRAMQLDGHAWLRFGIHNCSLTWITIFDDGKVSVRAVGDSGHLPPVDATF
ncbi:unnamed protein product (mitochondrion) [Plasmodiophora brassicae]|uniref:Serine/threonine-protein phosphatase PGAM5, mitochondrial n=1 Tax=Plasmodiophora brassicae TaxID=37360 RepID=A0A3P3Y5H0_PLABS|nr:unnamed protein product [Plasmodiophora brassicae]